jgi:hypothetical protein
MGKLITVEDDHYTQIQLTRGNSNVTATIQWQVLECDDFTVQSGEFSGHGNVNISEVDLSKAFISISNTAGGHNSAYAYRALTRAKFNSSSQIEITCQNTGVSNTTCWNVVEWDGATVQSDVIDITSGNSSNTANIDEVDLGESFILHSYYGSSTGTDADRAVPRVHFADSTTVQATRGSTSDACSVSVFVISHPDITVQSGTDNTGDTQITDSISDVDLSASFMPTSSMGNAYVSGSNRPDAVCNTHEQTATDAISIDRYNTVGDLYAAWFVVSGSLDEGGEEEYGWDNPGAFTANGNFGGWVSVGWRFTAKDDIVVKGLRHIGNYDGNTHKLNLFDTTTGNIVGTCNVTTTNKGQWYVGTFASSVTLVKDRAYIVATNNGSPSTGTFYYYRANPASEEFNSDLVTFVGGRIGGTVDVMPTTTVTSIVAVDIVV